MLIWQVADALLRLEHRYAGFLPGLRLRCPDQTAKLVGRVFTVQWKASHPDEPVAKNYTGHYVGLSFYIPVHYTLADGRLIISLLKLSSSALLVSIL